MCIAEVYRACPSFLMMSYELNDCIIHYTRVSSSGMLLSDHKTILGQVASYSLWYSNRG